MCRAGRRGSCSADVCVLLGSSPIAQAARHHRIYIACGDAAHVAAFLTTFLYLKRRLTVGSSYFSLSSSRDQCNKEGEEARATGATAAAAAVSQQSPGSDA